MSPIYTRPIREQAEHDRVIRQLQVRYKRKHEVAINPGPERNQAVMVGDLSVFRISCWTAPMKPETRREVEVETGESVHLLEARAEWAVFSRLKVPFHLYVPPQSIESAKRMCEEQQFPSARNLDLSHGARPGAFHPGLPLAKRAKAGARPIPKVAAKPKAGRAAKAAPKPEPKAAKPALARRPP